MDLHSAESLKQFKFLIDQVDEPLKKTFENMHQGYPMETLKRFLRARDGNLANANKMLVDCLNWRIQNEIDNIFGGPKLSRDTYRMVRDSQLIGLSGYSKKGLPVFAIGVGQSTMDKAFLHLQVHHYIQSHIQINEYRDHVLLPKATERHGRYIGSCLKVLDMSGLKVSALSQIKVLTTMATIDDLNYPEKTETYFVVNAPYVFSSCWKVVRPLLHERTKRKIQILQGSGTDELLKVMDYSALPHFCKRKGSGLSNNGSENCYSLDHEFHRELYEYIKKQASFIRCSTTVKQVTSEGVITELHKLVDLTKISSAAI
ncbi:hypothetical protein AMTRI_Chr06g199320 [Amborella trichopoda]